MDASLPGRPPIGAIMRGLRQMHMPLSRRTAAVVILGLCVLSSVTRAQSGSQAKVDAAPAELVGRWSLIAVIRNGIDTTRSGLTQGPVASVYDFKSDGTFTITLGEKVQETGTWSANATVTPKIFDHIPTLPNGRKPLVPGIYEVGGGVLKMCLLPASEANTHPTRCESLTENRSSIYIFMRAK